MADGATWPIRHHTARREAMISFLSPSVSHQLTLSVYIACLLPSYCWYSLGILRGVARLSSFVTY